MNVIKFIASGLISSIVSVIIAWLILVFFFPKTNVDNAIGLLLVAAAIGLSFGIILYKRVKS